jgi:hypothetical protein
MTSQHKAGSMWLIKKHKLKTESPGKDKLAGYVANGFLKMQAAFTNKLNKPFQTMSTGKLKIVLLLFCLCCGSYSIYLVVSGIVGNNQKQVQITGQIQSPKYFDKSGNETISGDDYVDENTYRRIQLFKLYMDSLKTFNKKNFDSILQSRPGLMDSVKMLEAIYRSQKQK